MANFMQKLVSKKKRRVQEDGFDLDMTFITKNVVAMGFPAEGMEGVYRNNMSDVKRYFDLKHKDHYKVYNLCSERGYDPAKFYGRVANYPFDDHNAPPFVLLKPFCEDVHQYLTEDERNVAVIHCKAGKGRTGVMICAYLLHNRMWTETKDSLEFYGHARTKNGKGVTIPSQIRYVSYYGDYLKGQREYRPTTLLFKAVRLVGIPIFQSGTCVPYFTIRQGPEKVLIFKSQIYEGISKDQREAVLRLEQPTPVCGDVKVEFFHKSKTGKEKMFHLWFNTFFIENNVLTAPKATVDKANKDKKHKIYPADFAVECHFDSPERDLRSNEAEKAAVKMEAEVTLAAGKTQHAGDKDNIDELDEPAPGVATATLSAEAPATATTRPPASARHSAVSDDDSDLTTDEEEEDDEDVWQGLPITDI